MKLLIDHLHSFGTDIRTSPDRTLNEVLITRRIANSIVHDLRRTANDTSLLVPELKCVSLNSRLTRLRRYARHYGPSNILLIVVATASAKTHMADAASSGWSIIRSADNPQSETLADCLTNTAVEELGPLAIARTASAANLHLLSTLPLLTDIPCPAVITVNLGISCPDDIKKLSTPEGRQQIVNLHVNGILDYLSTT